MLPDLLRWWEGGGRWYGHRCLDVPVFPASTGSVHARRPRGDRGRVCSAPDFVRHPCEETPDQDPDYPASALLSLSVTSSTRCDCRHVPPLGCAAQRCPTGLPEQFGAVCGRSPDAKRAALIPEVFDRKSADHGQAESSGGSEYRDCSCRSGLSARTRKNRNGDRLRTRGRMFRSGHLRRSAACTSRCSAFCRNSALRRSEPARDAPKRSERPGFVNMANRSPFWTSAQLIGSFPKKLPTDRSLAVLLGTRRSRRLGVRIQS